MLKKGDFVKLTSVRAWGGNRGKVMLVRRAQVTRVSKAGYASIDARPSERYQPVANSPDGLYREWSPKTMAGFADSIITIAPISAEEYAGLPATNEDARAYARRLLQET
ncbi:hypothetical protein PAPPERLAPAPP_04220 [Brevundimonas phage vB_BpoS-Papperlapapp]|uniref:Uncharacterized protein n=2 Tax=Marchewkavirus TaxID=3425052 RepID=A0A9E7SJW5_9CAUD|nr:hypothetical protein KABACHOK_02600 [Brevundimonas phage vB_BpoS-Kabachok]USN14791.1 hypothetical protein DOMOVOI_03170 [Brevundimonas phage vB_BpoS-Domovoi]USN16163.1 hypothetical protein PAPPERLAPAPP_04220 [Brevundimonas phage vB_BpoS-Papperlapapp]